jgi:integrase
LRQQGLRGRARTWITLQLLSLTIVRPGELRAAEWSEIDLDAAVWAIPLPLAPQAVALLRSLSALTGSGRFLFPSVRAASRYMSENTINAVLRRLGFAKEEMSGHGFRSAASSILNESGLWHADAVERQLAHVDNDAVRRAYARRDYREERARMMNWWAEKCHELQGVDN